MPKKKDTDRPRKYGEYVTEIDKKLYAIVRLPLGNGKYQTKTILLDKIGGNKTEARKWAWNELENHKKGSFDKREAISWTFDRAARWYKKEFLVPPVFENGLKVEGLKDYKKQKGRLDNLVAFFGARKINNFTDDDIRRFIRHRRDNDKVKIVSINRDFALMKTLFKRLQKQIGKHFEVPDFPINAKAETERDRVLTWQEERDLLSVCVDEEIYKTERYKKPLTMKLKCNRSHLRPIIIVAVDTAMRQGEIMKLIWSDVDFDTETITIQFFNAKTEKTRKVGMTPRMKEELLKLKDSKETLDLTSRVFGIASPKKAFDTACDRANIKDLHFHDLRHTATTRMIRAGIPHAEVMKITGHTQIKTFMRYLNLVNETIKSNASQLANYVDSQTIIEVESEKPN